MSYTVKGKIVSYVSAERGEMEELPDDLVDWDATHKWERDHPPADEVADERAQPPAPAIDPELLKEEADRRALTPEVAPDLNLPEQDSVVALDYFQGTPELVPLVQTEGDLNHTTSHNILKLSLNPRAAPHQIVQLKGVEAAVQMHVDQPVIYLRVGDDSGISRGGTPLVVDTHGAGNAPAVKPDSSGGSRRQRLRDGAGGCADGCARAGELQHRDAGHAEDAGGRGRDDHRDAAGRPLDEGDAEEAAGLRRVCADGGASPTRRSTWACGTLACIRWRRRTAT